MKNGQTRCYGSPEDGHCIQSGFLEETTQALWSSYNEVTSPGSSEWPSWGC